MRSPARLLSLLLLVLSLCLMPISSAAGDPSEDGSSTGDGSSGSGTGTGSGSGSGDGGGSQGPAGVSVPRVMVEGFTVEPPTVFAGQEFTVNFSLRNTSKTTAVQNMLVTVSSPDSAFLPLGGSSSLFVSRIRAERVSGQTMTFRALPSLEAKPYPLTIALEYEDTQANAYQSSETLAIEVNQELRAAASTPQLLPTSLTVGQQGSLTFTVQNQGKAKLFNATATIAEGQGLAPGEAFVGNIDPGSSGAVDMTVTALEPTTGPVRVDVTYEDVAGESFTLAQEIAVDVVESAPQEEPGEEFPMEPEPMGTGLPVLPLAIGAAILIAAVVTLLLVRANRRKKARLEDEASLAAMSGDPLIGDDWS